MRGKVLPLNAALESSRDFRCSQCSYQIVVQEPHPACPMCGGDAWVRVAGESRAAL